MESSAISSALPPISVLCRFLRPNCENYDSHAVERAPTFAIGNVNEWKSDSRYHEPPCYVPGSHSEIAMETSNGRSVGDEPRIWTTCTQTFDSGQLANEAAAYRGGYSDYGRNQPAELQARSNEWIAVEMQEVETRPHSVSEQHRPTAEAVYGTNSIDHETATGLISHDPSLMPHMEEDMVQPPSYDYAVAHRPSYPLVGGPAQETPDLYYYATTADSLWTYQSQNGLLTHNPQQPAAVSSAPNDVVNPTPQAKKKPGRRPANGVQNANANSCTAQKMTKKQRRRIPTQNQRKAANIRERRRMFNLNAAFDCLRKRVPTFAYEKNLSRIETLRLAISYIRFMDDLLVENRALGCGSDRDWNVYV